MCRLGLIVVLFMSIWASPSAEGGDVRAKNLVANPGFESDENGDGFPDDWFSAGDKSHPANWHCGRAKGKPSLSTDAHSGRFSLLYVSPKPYDWRQEKALDVWDFTSWQEARKKLGTRFYYSAPVVSKEFNIDYPKVYKVSAWVKGENIAGLHIKFIGISPKGDPRWFSPALRTPQGSTGKTGSWDWEKWETVIIANRGMGWKGRIEAWMRENVTDGRFWIDDVKVEEVDHAGRGLQPVLRCAARMPHWPSIPARENLSTPSKRRVQKTDSEIAISFKNGTIIVFNTSDAAGGPGIARVSVRGRRLRRATPPIRPLVETESGGRYAACRYVGCVEKEDHVVVRTELTEKVTGTIDSLDWILAPAELDVYERKHVGFRYSYRFESKKNLAIGIWDRATWEPDGEVDGLFVKCPSGPRTTSITQEMGFEGRPSIPFLRTPCFDFQARSKTGIVLGFFDGLGHVETWLEKRSGERRVHHFAHHYFTSNRRIQTVPRCVVFSECGELDPLRQQDEHTWALDVIEEKYRREVGLKDIPLLPTVRLHPHAAKEGKFENYIEFLPDVKRLGFRVVMLNPIWEGLDGKGNPKPGVCSVTGLEVAKAFGGEAGLRKLANAVHAHDMKLVTWAPTGLNRRDCRLLRDYPDWMCRLPDGKPRTYGGASSLLTYVSLASGYLDYSLERYRRLRNTIGLDGFWQDSFQAVGQLHYENPKRVASYLEAGLKRQAQLQRMGYEILNIEGYGPFGNDSPSGTHVLTVGGRQHYKTSPYYYLVLGPETYYRCVANKGMPILPYYDSKHPYHVNRNVATNPYVRAEVQQANHDYAVVRAKMKRRFLIPSKTNPWQEIGVLWRDEQTSEEVLFAYGTFQYRIGRTRSVEDVTTGEAVAVADGTLSAVPGHTYLIRK